MKYRLKFLSLILLLASSSVVAIPICCVNGSSIEMNRVTTSSYQERSPIYLSGDLELLEAASENGWEGLGTQISPIIIQGYSIRGNSWLIRLENIRLHFTISGNHLNGYTSDWSSILIRNCTNFSINENVLLNGTTGIRILNSSHYSITNNSLTDYYTGIYIENCTGPSLVSNNHLYECRSVGITIIESLSWQEEPIQIQENLIENTSSTGIYLRHCRFTTISDNLIYSSFHSGIILSGEADGSFCTIRNNTIIEASRGISLMASNNSLQRNIIKNCTEGIRIQSGTNFSLSASHNVVSWNVFALCSEYGLVMESSCSNNTISANDFVLNSRKPQASDSGYSNSFDNNFYSDTIDPDSNNDEIVDFPYDIDGDALNRDLRPSTTPHRNESVLIIEQAFSIENPFEPDDLVRITIASVLSATLILAIICYLKKHRV